MIANIRRLTRAVNRMNSGHLLHKPVQPAPAQRHREYSAAVESQAKIKELEGLLNYQHASTDIAVVGVPKRVYLEAG